MKRALGGLLAVCVACTPTFEPESTVEDRTLKSVTPTVARADELQTPAVVRALTARDGAMLLGTDQGFFVQRGSEAPQPVEPRVLDPNDVAHTGAVRVFARRPNGNLLVGAAQGLFLWNDRELLSSPASQVAKAPVLLAAGAIAGEERVAAVSDGALWWLGGASLRLAPDLDGAPEAMALLGSDLFVARGTTLLRLHYEGEAFEENVLQIDFGTVRQLAGDTQDGALWVATDQGVLRRVQRGEQTHWLRWELDDVRSIAVDPDGGAVWARTGTKAQRISAFTEESPTLPLEGAPGPLALDTDGILWLADGASARLVKQPGMQAPPPSFANQVAPFAQRSCAACHSAAQSLPLVTQEQWARNAQRILLNLRVGTMPRGNPLAPGDYRVVERWINGGMLP